MSVNLYPEMNEKIVGILRIGNVPPELYAAALIESLQAENAQLRTEIDKAEDERDKNEILLYLVTRMKVMQAGLEQGRTTEEINQMAYDSMIAMFDVADWEKAGTLLASVKHSGLEAQNENNR